MKLKKTSDNPKQYRSSPSKTKKSMQPQRKPMQTACFFDDAANQLVFDHGFATIAIHQFKIIGCCTVFSAQEQQKNTATRALRYEVHITDQELNEAIVLLFPPALTEEGTHVAEALHAIANLCSDCYYTAANDSSNATASSQTIINYEAILRSILQNELEEKTSPIKCQSLQQLLQFHSTNATAQHEQPPYSAMNLLSKLVHLVHAVNVSNLVNKNEADTQQQQPLSHTQILEYSTRVSQLYVQTVTATLAKFDEYKKKLEAQVVAQQQQQAQQQTQDNKDCGEVTMSEIAVLQFNFPKAQNIKNFYTLEEFNAQEKGGMNLKLIEDRFDEIKQEFMTFYTSSEAEKAAVPPGATFPMEKLQTSWKNLWLVYGDEIVAKTAQFFPKTAEILKLATNNRIRREVLFSIMDPFTYIPPHVGNQNTVLRCQLGISGLSPYCGIHVGTSKKEEFEQQREGKVIVFDDSRLHSAWNYADHKRIVLIFDFIHPDLTCDDYVEACKQYKQLTEKHEAVMQKLNKHKDQIHNN